MGNEELNKKELLNKLENRFEEINKEYEELHVDWVGDFEGTKDYHEYKGLENHPDVQKDMFKDRYEQEQKINEIKAKLDAYEAAIIDAAKDVYASLSKKATEIEKKLEVDKKHVEKLEAEIEAKKQEIEELQASEAYKNNDYETMLQVETLEGELAQKVARKEEISSGLKDKEAQLEKIKTEMDELVTEYGENIKQVNEKEPVEEEKQKQNNVEEKQDKQAKKEQEPEKETDEQEAAEKGKNKKENVRYVVVPEGTNNELSEEEKAKKEQEQKEKEENEKQQKLKEEFEDLKTKAKKGTLTDKEFDSLVSIMKDKENYEKLGITIGVMFNKSRGIFKSLNKYAGEDEQKINSVNDAYKSYEELFYEKHGEKKLNMLSKFFQIDEVERKNEVPALPENTVEDKKTLGEELSSKTVPDEEYKDVEVKETLSKDEQEQTK